MDKWEKLYQFIKNLEDEFYDIAFDAMKEDRVKFLYFESLANHCRKIRYIMEEYESEEE